MLSEKQVAGVLRAEDLTDDQNLPGHANIWKNALQRSPLKVLSVPLLGDVFSMVEAR